MPGVVAYLAGSACLVQACHQNCAGSKHQSKSTHSAVVNDGRNVLDTIPSAELASAISFLSRVLQAAGNAGEGFHQLNTIDGDVEMAIGCRPHHLTKPLGVRCPKDHCMEDECGELSLHGGDGLGAISIAVVTIRHEEQNGCER